MKRQKIAVITDDTNLILNNDIISITHPKSQVYNDNKTPTNNWIILKLPFCKEILLNPWMYKTIILSYGFLKYKIYIIGNGRFTKYARKILDKEKYSYFNLKVPL